MNKDKLEQALNKIKGMLILMGGGTMCLLFMAVTQLDVIKNLSYLLSNAMALLTCLPMAIGIIVFGKSFHKIFENKMLDMIGAISYEIYLVHVFTLAIVKPSIIRIFIFVVITVTLAYATYFTMGKMKNGKFNNYYPHKE